MRTIKLLLAASVASLGVCIAAPVSAQVTARVVASCGSPTYVAGTNNYQTVDTTGKLCSASTSTPSGTADTNIIQVGGVTLLRGAGATGTGSPRVTVAQDATTVAGSPSVPAGSAIIGKVGIDQTTPGTTNGVSATNLPTTVSTGAGATGASSPRTTVAQDTTTIAGSPTSTVLTAAPAAATSGGAGGLCTGQIKATATACGTAAAHTAYVYDFGNAANAATSYIQVFDVAVGSVVLGTTVAKYSFELPAGGGRLVPIPVGDSYSNQITIACTTTATGLTAPASNCSYNVIGK